MVQSFSFDFGGDDIEDDGEVEVEERMEISGNQESEASLIAPKVHTLEEMVCLRHFDTCATSKR